MNYFKQLTRQEWGLLLLRFGLAIVFLWFGFSQLLDGLKWVSIVPEWATDLLNIPPAMIVLANGLFEVVLSTLLAMGFWVRIVSFVLALHLIPITVDMGNTATGVRDFGLVVSAIALSLLYSKKNTSIAIENKISINGNY